MALVLKIQALFLLLILAGCGSDHDQLNPGGNPDPSGGSCMSNGSSGPICYDVLSTPSGQDAARQMQIFCESQRAGVSRSVCPTGGRTARCAVQANIGPLSGFVTRWSLYGGDRNRFEQACADSQGSFLAN